MATWTDRSSFRVISVDGELIDDHPTMSNGYALSDFNKYAAKWADNPLTIAQWYIVTDDGDGELLAESSDEGGEVVYPAADIFA